MRRQHRILFLLIVLLAAAALSPLLAGSAVHLWLAWKARAHNVTVQIDRVEAPYLKPVVLHGVRIATKPGTAFRFDLRLRRCELRLNFSALLFRTRGRWVRSIVAEGVRTEVHRNASGDAIPQDAYSTWQKILPNAGRLSDVDVRVEDGPIITIVRGGSLSFNDIETGRIEIKELTISSPLVRQTFSNLRGAARWQDDQLVLAGLTLNRGLAVQSLALDLAHLNKQRFGCEFDLDAYGGKLRGDITNQWKTEPSMWTIAGSANELSLTLTAEAIGVTEHVAGRIHAAKFTFRGSLRDPINATASVWLEALAPTWRDAKADSVMIGAALYNRQLDLQQLYVKQGKNELTLTGQSPLPGNWQDWLSSDFRGNISASIKNAGDFAHLFGGNPSQFAGDLTVEGKITSQARKLGGQLSIAGKALKLFNSPVDLLTGRLNLNENVVEVSDVNLKRGNDFVRADGTIDILHPENRVGSVELGVRDIAEYWPNANIKASLLAKVSLAGHQVLFDWLQLGGATTISVTGKIDSTDPGNLIGMFTPLQPIFEIVPPNSADCIDRVELLPAPNPKKLPPGFHKIDQVELRGDWSSGIHTITLQTDAGAEAYRTWCTDIPNRAWQIGALPKP